MGGGGGGGGGSKLCSLGSSHIGSLFTNEERRQVGL